MTVRDKVAQEQTWLVAGLGNPGSRYERTRHNAGFMVVDVLAQRLGVSGAFRERFEGLFAQAKGREGLAECHLLKPQTFMNLSGRAVQKALKSGQIDLGHLLVIHDEIDLPFGTFRVKFDGGLAGHNGLRSIAEVCGGRAFCRIRVGIGRPENSQQSVESYVLAPFSSDERAALGDYFGRVADAVESVLRHGIENAIQPSNQKQKAKPKV